MGGPVQFTLEISCVGGTVPPVAGGAEFGVIRGGPEELLRWLETQLGLGPSRDGESHRIACYARRVDAAAVETIAESITADRWEAAAVLLRRRDALRMGGWDGGPIPVDCSVVQAIAEIEAEQGGILCRRGDMSTYGEAERLDEITNALDCGQRLPPHRVVLLEPLEHWPWRWQRVIERLEHAMAEDRVPQSERTSSLGLLQRAAMAGEITDIVPDASLAWVNIPGAMSAVEYVAAILLEDDSSCGETVIACADPAMRLRMDHRFSAVGLPTTGVAVSHDASPAFQVLPLAIEMGFHSVSPEQLLDFLQLPIGPMPRSVSRRLARALSDQPGLGSECWETAWGELCSAESDPDGMVQPLLEQWLPRGGQTDDLNGVVSDDTLQLETLLKRCAMVSSWAREEASRMAAARPHRPPALSLNLGAAADQAEAVAELLQEERETSAVSTISRSQLAQILRATRHGGPRFQPFEREEGAARIVATPADIREPYDRLIWIGGWEDPPPASPWSASVVQQLNAAGIMLEPGENLQQARESRQRDGVALIRHRCLLIQSDANDSLATSSVWLHLESCLAGVGRGRRAVGIQKLVEGCETHSTLPIVRQQAGVESPQPARTSWRYASGSLPGVRRSASEITDHLACPLRWVLKRVAHIAPAGNVRLPRGSRLAGSFCHQVLRRAFEQEPILPSPAEATRRVGKVFDERVSLDASPLSRPEAASARGRLREQIIASTKRLVEILQVGEYRQVAFELPFETSLEAVPLEQSTDSVELCGVIDCLGRRNDGREVVIDFKFGGDARHRDAIQQGRAVQLATYAQSRFRITGQYPSVAYLVLSTAQVHAPRDSRPIGMRAEDCSDGPSIESVWRTLQRTLDVASNWHHAREPIPCRPLQSPCEWLPGLELVLDEPPRRGDFIQSCCRYCDYGALCGHVSLE